MVLHHVVSAQDRAAFLECRRAWDLSARERRNLRPVRQASALDVERAVREALAVYYFPGMWDWQPAVVLPLVRKAFTDSVVAQRARYLAANGRGVLGPDESRAVAELAEQGLALVEDYLRWAPTVDEIAPIQVLAELDVQVPDPRTAGRELAVGTRAVRYRDRADVLAMDAENGYWLVEHRFVHSGWPELDALVRDDRCLTWCWAWEYDNPGLHVQGTIYNELRWGASESMPEPVGPRSTVGQNRTVGTWLGPPADAAPEYDLRVRFGERFRRVQVLRRASEVAACGVRLAEQVSEMIAQDTRVYANPTVERCTPCPFRAPCLAMDTEDVAVAEALLTRSYRPREHAPQGGTLGARTWSIGRGAAPPSF